MNTRNIFLTMALAAGFYNSMGQQVGRELPVAEPIEEVAPSTREIHILGLGGPRETVIVPANSTIGDVINAMHTLGDPMKHAVMVYCEKKLSRKVKISELGDDVPLNLVLILTDIVDIMTGLIKLCEQLVEIGAEVRFWEHGEYNIFATEFRVGDTRKCDPLSFSTSFYKIFTMELNVQRENKVIFSIGAETAYTMCQCREDILKLAEILCGATPEYRLAEFPEGFWVRSQQSRSGEIKYFLQTLEGTSDLKIDIECLDPAGMTNFTAATDFLLKYLMPKMAHFFAVT